MKKLITSFQILFLLTLTGFIFSCGGNDKDEPEPAITIPSDQETTLSISDAGGELMLRFTSATQWTLSSNVDWAKVGTTAGEGSSQKVALTVLQNDTPDRRTATVTIQSGNVTKSFTIIQEQQDVLELITDDQEIGAEGGVITVKLNTNVEFHMAISNTSWIHALITSYSLSVQSYEFQVDANESKDDRNGEIIFSSGSLEQTLTIRQKGKPDVPVNGDTEDFEEEHEDW